MWQQHLQDHIENMMEDMIFPLDGKSYRDGGLVCLTGGRMHTACGVMAGEWPHDGHGHTIDVK